MPIEAFPVPHQLFESIRKHNLNKSEILLYLHFISSTVERDSDLPFDTQENISEKTGLSAPSVSKGIRTLEKCGLLYVQESDNHFGGKHRYALCHIDASGTRRFIYHKSFGKESTSTRNLISGLAEAPLKGRPLPKSNPIDKKNVVSRPPLLKHIDEEEPDGLLVECQEYAIQLKRGLGENNRIMRNVNLVKWRQEFYDFMSDTKIDAARLRRVLTWYCNNIGEQFVPKAYSAKSFCDKFNNIEDAAIRAVPIDSDSNVEVIETTMDEEDDDNFKQSLGDLL